MREAGLLFDTFKERLEFVAPSEVAKDVWGKTYPQYKDRVMVIYHQTMEGSFTDNKDVKHDGQPLNVAFVGYQRPLKGWDIWYDAVKKIHKDVNYKFFQFGTVSTHVDYITEVEVDFTKDLNSMINQLRASNIDVAILWSMLPETYSYTFYEAMAANAFILTNNKSGNIAYQVKRFCNGLVADNIDDLEKILADEKELRKNVNTFKTEGQCGPLFLKENERILSLVDFENRMPCERVSCRSLEKITVYIFNVLLRVYKELKRKKIICI